MQTITEDGPCSSQASVATEEAPAEPLTLGLDINEPIKGIAPTDILPIYITSTLRARIFSKIPPLEIDERKTHVLVEKIREFVEK